MRLHLCKQRLSPSRLDEALACSAERSGIGQGSRGQTHRQGRAGWRATVILREFGGAREEGRPGVGSTHRRFTTTKSAADCRLREEFPRGERGSRMRTEAFRGGGVAGIVASSPPDRHHPPASGQPRFEPVGSKQTRAFVRFVRREKRYGSEYGV